jgi:hypothetical protein
VWDGVTLPKIFWGKAEGELFVHAKHGNSLICTEGFQDQNSYKAIKDRPLREWIKVIRHKARPWDAVLEDTVKRMTAGQIEKLVLTMELGREERAKLLKNAPAETMKSLELTFTHTPTRFMMWSIGEFVRESQLGWELDRIRGATSFPISTGVLRIDEIHRGKDETWYKGRILFRGTETPFVEREQVVHAETGKWMRNVLLDAGVGLMRYQEEHQAKFVNIALTFNEPKVFKLELSVGWDGQTNTFNFPNFSIGDDGTVTQAVSLAGVDKKCPGAALQAP